ncbi:MAG: N-acetyltransferase [Chitinophagaceae bacterium]|nr:N-acetyltransferase [Chitinophagaceae bacterium]MDB5222845.1 N-acetyltransferase [Chitinophagaceae bacterium]
MPLQTPITNNIKQSRFETQIDGEFAYVDYRFYKDDIALMHTFVPEIGRGKGISSTLAKFALEYVKEQNLKLMVYCPFIAKYIKLHPEYESLIDKQYRR